MIEQKELLEHAVVYGDYKGIPKSEVRKGLDSGLDVVLRVDVQGAATIRSLVPRAVAIFLMASSEEEMVTRLRGRQTEDAGRLAMRIATAREELHRLAEFDYVVVNRDNQLDAAVQQVLAVMTAERCRVDWEPVEL
jgi:guanylate kinase